MPRFAISDMQYLYIVQRPNIDEKRSEARTLERVANRTATVFYLFTDFPVLGYMPPSSTTLEQEGFLFLCERRKKRGDKVGGRTTRLG